MAETMTTVEFKRVYGLSDSAFKRLVSKVKESNPGVEVTRRDGSTTWVIERLDLLEAEVKNKPISNAIVPAQPSLPAVAESNPFEMEVLHPVKFNRFSFGVSEVPEIASQQADSVGSEAVAANADALNRLRELNKQQAQILGSILGKEFVEHLETTKHGIIGNHVKKHGLSDSEAEAS